MIDPKYRGIEKEQIPIVQKNGMTIKVIAGKIDGVKGPVCDLAIDIEYLDVELPEAKTFEHATHMHSTVFAYVVDGSIEVHDKTIMVGHCAVFGEGDLVKIGSKKGARFLFVSGEPLKEPVAWGGPIVMNTEEELETAYDELDEGTFIKTIKSAKLS
jgi:redox-sensitive bicupin YhaK (pirin superfamily)